MWDLGSLRTRDHWYSLWCWHLKHFAAHYSRASFWCGLAEGLFKPEKTTVSYIGSPCSPIFISYGAPGAGFISKPSQRVDRGVVTSERKLPCTARMRNWEEDHSNFSSSLPSITRPQCKSKDKSLFSLGWIFRSLNQTRWSGTWASKCILALKFYAFIHSSPKLNSNSLCLYPSFIKKCIQNT